MATTSTQNTAKILREKILEGVFPPGTILRQEALAQELRVSRTPLRTALAELAQDGLVTYEANRGYTVRSFNVDDIRAAFEVRANLEGLACRLAAPRITEAQIERLQRCVFDGDRILSKGILDPNDLAPYRRLNVEFHETIIAASANPWITDFVNRTHNVPLASDRVFHWEDHAIIFRSHNDHHRILNALSTGNAIRAEALMWEHVTNAGDVLVEHVAPRIIDRQTPISLQPQETEKS